MNKPKKKATLSAVDLRLVRELLQAELRPLKDEVRKVKRKLDAMEKMKLVETQIVVRSIPESKLVNTAGASPF